MIPKLSFNMFNNLNSSNGLNTIKPFDKRIDEINKNINKINNDPTEKITDFSTILPNAPVKKPVRLLEPQKLINLIQSNSQKYGIDKKLINAIIKHESGYNLNAVSSAGAVGLMQLMPKTASSLGVTNPADPSQNIEGGTKYLKQLLDKYNGNMVLAIAAYNAGPGNVDKHKGVPNFKETQNYVQKVLGTYLESLKNS